MNTETTDKGEYTFAMFRKVITSEQKKYMLTLLNNAKQANQNNLLRLDNTFNAAGPLHGTPRYKQRVAEKEMIESILKELGI